ncbi:MAG: universal stress protein [Chloroflexi bacterium]|nr:universal stress protein [Chloroflexota bacterium]
MSFQSRQHRPKVLVALDGSPAGATALPLARVVARQLAAEVEILHVASDLVPEADLWRRLHADLGPGEVVQVRSHGGQPAAAILHAAAAPGVALVVLTTHGRTVEPGRTLGRVARAVIAGTQRPLLLVRPEAASEPRVPSPLGRLLLPVDGTPGTAAALRPATDLAGRLGASIDLLYVASSEQAAPWETGSIGAPRYVDQAHHEWPRWADEVVDRLYACIDDRPAGVSIRMYLAQGEIGAEITRFAAEHQDDAIVLVRRSRLEPGRARVLQAVLHQMPCPALLVEGPGQAEHAALTEE